MTTVLDLPIEKQKELAKQCGYADFSLWQKEISKSLEETRTAADKLENSASCLFSLKFNFTVTLSIIV